MGNMSLMIDGAKQVSAKYDQMKLGIDIIRITVTETKQKIVLLEEKVSQLCNKMDALMQNVGVREVKENGKNE